MANEEGKAVLIHFDCIKSMANHVRNIYGGLNLEFILTPIEIKRQVNVNENIQTQKNILIENRLIKKRAKANSIMLARQSKLKRTEDTIENYLSETSGDKKNENILLKEVTKKREVHVETLTVQLENTIDATRNPGKDNIFFRETREKRKISETGERKIKSRKHIVQRWKI